uniref:Uncharacterized protein n=1 Tax=Rhizophora mucronata TaxID=61149 RepID=A0A2P2R281_RHIMU
MLKTMEKPRCLTIARSCKLIKFKKENRNRIPVALLQLRDEYAPHKYSLKPTSY